MNNYENVINTLLDGRYRLTGIIGIGGMAVVYEADDLAMNRKVAVKMLKDEIKEDVRELKRFKNESKAVAMLSHPNIVNIYDVSVNEPGKNSDNSENYQYIVMELIDGITLKDYIIRKGKLKWQEALSYTEQILAALNHAHEKGIIHRDVKPQNVMLLRNGNLKIMDFGIAKMPDSEPLTMTDKAIGTVHYISPEQANGMGTVSTVSDIYSVGIILYEMTTGKLPFNGNTAIQVALMQINDTPQNPRVINPEIPRGLSQIILKAMSKSPSDRYQTAGEMIKNLNILSANPAVVFNAKMQNPGTNSGTGNNNNNINVKDNNNKNRNNLPVVAGNTGNAGNRRRELSVKNDVKDIASISIIGNNKENRSIENVRQQNDEISEGEMRRRGRVPQNKLRRKNSRSMLPIISGVTLAFLIVLGVSAVNIILSIMQAWGDDSEDTVEIPNYIGQVYDDAIKVDMQRLRLTEGEIKYEANDNYAENQIIYQSPEPKDIKKFTNSSDTIPISFTISKGKESYTVEDLSVTRYLEAEIMLKMKQITPERIDQPDETIPSGYIIYTEPGLGSVLNSGETIKIYVSSGQDIKKTIMPDVVGKSEREARKILTEEKIILGDIISEYSDYYAPGYITEQDIEKFKSVPAKSTRVNLKISMGPRPTQAPPPTEAPPPQTEPPATEPPPAEANLPQE